MDIRYLRQVVLRLAVGLLSKGRGIIFIPLIAKALGSHGYGIFSQVMISVTFLTLVVTLGLRETCVRYIAGEKDKEKIGVRFSTITTTFLTAFLITLLGGFILKKELSFLIFSEYSYVPYIYWLFLLLFARTNYYVGLSIYRAQNRVLSYSIIEIVQILTEIGIVLCFFYSNTFSISTILASFVGVELALSVIVAYHTFSRYGISFPDVKLAKKFLKYGVPLIFGDALFQIVDASDRFFIAHLLGLEKAGIYSVTYNLSKIIHIIVPAILFPLFPLVTKYWKENDKKKLDSQIGLALKIYSFLGVPMVIGFFRIYPHLLLKLTSKEFLIEPSILIFLLGAFFIVGMSYMFHYLIYVSDKTYIFGFILLFIAVANVVMNYILIPMYGMVGAAFATFISYLVYFLVLFFIASRIFALSWPVKFMSCCACIGAFMFLPLKRIPCETIPWILVNCLAGGLIYVVGWCIVALLNGYKVSTLISKLRELKNEAI